MSRTEKEKIILPCTNSGKIVKTETKGVHLIWKRTLSGLVEATLLQSVSKVPFTWPYPGAIPWSKGFNLTAKLKEQDKTCRFLQKTRFSGTERWIQDDPTLLLLLPNRLKMGRRRVQNLSIRDNCAKISKEFALLSYLWHPGIPKPLVSSHFPSWALHFWALSSSVPKGKISN